MVQKVLLASPRGFCAGVVRAIDIVDKALELYGTPLYVRREIVHNHHVVSDFEKRGVTFVQELDSVPNGSRVIFSAHGVSPAVKRQAMEKKLQAIDATCPLVTKVHAEAVNLKKKGYTIVLIGHAGHDEVEGTTGEAPDNIVLVQNVEEAEQVQLPAEDVSYITQTTLSIDDTQAIVDVLKRRFTHIEGPAKEDICYATQNRQNAVKELVQEAQLILVVGAKNSSNSNRLVDTARAAGVESYLIDSVDAIDENWLVGKDVVGVTSGASAPDQLVQGVVSHFLKQGATITTVETAKENIQFVLPAEIRMAMEKV